MIEIQPLHSLDLADLTRIISGYTADGRYDVAYAETDDHTLLELQYVPLAEPYVKHYDPYDEETLQYYINVLNHRFSFGAYDDETLVGLILAEPYDWNLSLWVWEFHVAESYRGRGTGRLLMESAAGKARSAGLRAIVCETQNTNVPAIRAYRKFGFRVEGIDISYYTNRDYPSGEVAVFMKRRLGE